MNDLDTKNCWILAFNEKSSFDGSSVKVIEAVLYVDFWMPNSFKKWRTVRKMAVAHIIDKA